MGTPPSGWQHHGGTTDCLVFAWHLSAELTGSGLCSRLAAFAVRWRAGHWGLLSGNPLPSASSHIADAR